VRQVVVTSVYGQHAEMLDRTFTSFLQKTDAQLHAFVLGDRLPSNRCDGITYHLIEPDNTFGHPYREACYRRWEYLDLLDTDTALVVDGTDVLCMQPIPPFETLLRGASLAASAEHRGGRYIQGQGYTGVYLNGGVTWWDIPKSRQMRADICARGRTQCRTIVGDNQMSLNDVVQTCYYDDLVVLPSQYNYRAFLHIKRRGWPTVSHLDGVVIYHNGACIEAAKSLEGRKAKAALSPLEYKAPPTSGFGQFLLRARNRLRPHLAE